MRADSSETLGPSQSGCSALMCFCTSLIEKNRLCLFPAFPNAIFDARATAIRCSSEKRLSPG